MSALPLKADMCSALAHVRFGPIADIQETRFSPKEKPRGHCQGTLPPPEPSGRASYRLMGLGGTVGPVLPPSFGAIIGLTTGFGGVVGPVLPSTGAFVLVVVLVVVHLITISQGTALVPVPGLHTLWHSLNVTL
jgi:hypothetical protein